MAFVRRTELLVDFRIELAGKVVSSDSAWDVNNLGHSLGGSGLPGDAREAAAETDVA